MSDDLKFASPDERSFQWPRSEIRRPRPSVHPPRKQQPISRHELVMLKSFRQARTLARRWEAGDEDVTMHDIIAILIGENRE
jgi:hypothetical protein